MFAVVGKQKRERSEWDLVWNTNSFRVQSNILDDGAKSNIACKSYCIPFVDPFVAIVPRFCSFALLHSQNFDYGLRPSLRMTRSRKDDRKP